MKTSRSIAPLPSNPIIPSATRGLAHETKLVLQAYRVRPREVLGQNFLIDSEALESIVAAGQIKPDDQVLEIGPGIGTLTLALAATGANIVSIELDSAMAHIASERSAQLPNVTIIEGNILHLDLETCIDTNRPFKVVANIPYYITGPILRKFLEGAHAPSVLVLMVQREVGERLAARPGDMSALSVFAQIYAKVEVVRHVPRTSFLPPPAVASVVMRLTTHIQPILPKGELPYFLRVVKAGFGSKRKMLHNALDHALPNDAAAIDTALREAEIERSRRAETLSIQEWLSLTNALRQDVLHVPRSERLPPDGKQSEEVRVVTHG